MSLSLPPSLHASPISQARDTTKLICTGPTWLPTDRVCCHSITTKVNNQSIFTQYLLSWRWAGGSKLSPIFRLLRQFICFLVVAVYLKFLYNRAIRNKIKILNIMFSFTAISVQLFETSMAKVIATVDAFQRRNVMVALYTHFCICTKTVFYMKFTVSFPMYMLKASFAEKVFAVTTLNRRRGVALDTHTIVF